MWPRASLSCWLPPTPRLPRALGTVSGILCGLGVCTLHTPIALQAQLQRQPFSSSSRLPRGFVPAVFSAWSDLRVAGSVCRSHLGVCVL